RRGLAIASRAPFAAAIPSKPQRSPRQNTKGVGSAFLPPGGVQKESPAAVAPAVEKAVKEPSIVAKLAPLGMVQDYAAPEKLVAEMREEYQAVEEIAKKAGLVK